MRGEREPLAIAREHPDVGEQVMAEIDGLRALQVRVSGQRPVEVPLGGVDQRRHQVLDPRSGVGRRLAHEHRDVGDHLVVARARGVKAPAGAPGDLGHTALDGHVDVLVAGLEREAAVAQLGLDGVERRSAAHRGPRRR